MILINQHQQATTSLQPIEMIDHLKQGLGIRGQVGFYYFLDIQSGIELSLVIL